MLMAQTVKINFIFSGWEVSSDSSVRPPSKQVSHESPVHLLERGSRSLESLGIHAFSQGENGSDEHGEDVDHALQEPIRGPIGGSL